MNPFLITCLPRSRSAFLSVLLTTDHSLCYHDRPYERYLVEGSGKHIGFAGSEIVTQWNEIREHYPNAPWLVVLRDEKEAYKSFLKKASGIISVSGADPKPWWQDKLHRLALCCAHANVLAVDYHQLDDEQVIRRIWSHLLPEIAFDRERWELLDELNIQQDKKAERRLCELTTNNP